MVIVCDCKYRSAITAIRAFSRLGEDVVAVTVDSSPNPSAFSSKYIKEKHILPSDTTAYTKELLALCKKYVRPVLFPTGNFTLSVISNNLDAFYECADFCVSSHEIIEKLNDKKWVKNEAQKLGLNVPRVYKKQDPIVFPVVVKPYCGEKFNLKAEQRYRIARNSEELDKALRFFEKFDPSPIIEEYIDGVGVGVSFLVNDESEAVASFSHRRLVEYPVMGGPSACLETVYSPTLINDAKKFIEQTGFSGLCMIEFKEKEDKYYLLEVNPRVWGSFPATEKASSNMLCAYIDAAQHISYGFDTKYKVGCKIKFSRGLLAATLSHFKNGRFKKALSCIVYLINPNVKNALFSIKDPLPALRDFFRR